MNRYKITVFFAFLLFTINILKAQDNYALSTNLVTITGTSTLHNWNEKVESISGKGNVKKNADKSLSLQSFKIIIKVNSIKSNEGSSMNNKTYKTLKADKYPEITFVLTEPVANIPYGANAYVVTTKGLLTIAGVTKPIIMPLKITLNDEKKITVDGAQQIKMTDYGMDPPTLFFGTIKVGDNITVNFKTTFSSIN